MRSSLTAIAAAAAIAALAVPAAAGDDWSNIGGNACRNGRTSAIGPDSATPRWSGGPSSVIAWNPSIEGDRLFVVRQTGFIAPGGGMPNDSKVYAMSVTTGAVLWSFACPYVAGDWTTNVYGVKDGRVFVGRGGNGSSAFAPVYCLDAATGGVLWTSAQEVGTGAYDGVTFAPDGDPIFATNLYVRRVDAQTGATVWNSTRSCSVSGDCGPAISGNSVYVDEVGPGGQVLTRFDLNTGARLYSSPVMPGFLSQSTPFCGPEGTVFYVRYQNNQAVDFLYAFQDTGSAFTQLWTAPAIGGPGGSFGVTADDGVIFLAGSGRLEKRDAFTGSLLAETTENVAASITQSHVAIDGAGRIYYGNGGFPGTIYSFEADLSLRWSIPVANLNQGGPVLAADGTLLVAGTGTTFLAYRTEPACVPADFDCDGSVGPADLTFLLAAWGGGKADLNGDGLTGSADLTILLAAWG
jgi:hypothetical protein